MTHHQARNWLRTTTKAACLLLAVISLSGCIIAPYPGYYHHRSWYHY